MSNTFDVEVKVTSFRTKFNPARVGAWVSGDGDNRVDAVDTYITRAICGLRYRCFVYLHLSAPCTSRVVFCPQLVAIYIHKYINKTTNSFSLVGRRGGVSVAFRKIVNPDSRELCTIREWRDFSETDSTGLPLISAALA